MTQKGRKEKADGDRPKSRRRSIRLLVLVSVGISLLSLVPTVSAHGGAEASGFTQSHGLAIAGIGALAVGALVLLKRRERISPRAALYGIAVGIGVAVAGAILFEGLAPDPTYQADSMPFSRSLYQPLAIGTGLLVVVASFITGLVRWTTRPRYMALGILFGGWILYPYLLPGFSGYTNPIGYGIVLATPLLVGYILWKDVGAALSTILRDSVARRFGFSVGVMVSLFFMATAGYLSFFSEEGAPQETTIAVLNVLYQIVRWPTLEVLLPDVPFFIAISPGVVIVLGLLGVLVGLNAAAVAHSWRLDRQAGATQSTAGTATVVGACTCGCCGPLVSQVAVIAAGPTIAAPIYWIFVDSASPLSSIFLLGSIALFTGTLVYSIDSPAPIRKDTSEISTGVTE
ncbi:hypothetical protein PN419_14475 [Halorubrum ezzemoulense]|jgi:hypothetical protein|uniref:Uncharacterized protein n=1 Tax=Halorubrum salinarum TaxID=2739057 RepID=A0A7D3Y255_9EURY|nr:MULTISPECIES: hypothetical protein [Halorubrum]MDB9234673.1 hypothetical protein [Halorubrum ezzemoulense]MDB9250191.1 hypothetical protein [Halorubrum ezzemoulense]MDB9260431.1 hypothetical protein [Halorubrum ezzemoulense]MDB9263727.1 hypothetical protein [Halorubrum ezzemoulense]MDB9267256.1 hypothetical protein [Halorubrum ezzemoulense]